MVFWQSKYFIIAITKINFALKALYRYEKMLNISLPDAESNYIQAELQKAGYSSRQMYTLWNISIYTRKGLRLDWIFLACRRGGELK